MRRILAERTYHVLSRPPTRYIPEGVPFASFYPAAEPEFGGLLPFLGRLLKKLLFLDSHIDGIRCFLRLFLCCCNANLLGGRPTLF